VRYLSMPIDHKYIVLYENSTNSLFNDLARTPGADLKFNKEGAVRNRGFEGLMSPIGL